MKVLVAGAGAIGGWLGARLKAHADVTLLGRPALAKAISTGGLRISGHTDFEGRLPVIAEPAGDFDVVIITAKAHATAGLAEPLAGLNPDATFVTFQNGIGNADVLAQHIKSEQVVVGLTSHGVLVEAPGQLRHAGMGMVKVGPAPGHPWSEHCTAVYGLLQDAGLSPQRIDDSTGHIWLKAIVNHGINPLCALHGIPNGGLQDHWDHAAELVDEAVALSRAAGIRLPGDARKAWEETVAGTTENRCSMLQDVEAGRVTEIEQITGYFIRLARRLGYPMPLSDKIYREIKALESGYLGKDAALATARQAAEAFTF